MNYIKKLWRGEVTLWKIYWLWGSLGNVLFRIFAVGITYLTYANARSLSPFDIAAIHYVLAAVWVAYNVLILSGIWRSAANYEIKHQNEPKKHFARLAKVGVLLSVLALAAGTLKSFQDEPLSSSDPEQKLHIAAMLSGLNKDLPKQVDSATRLDRIDYKDDAISYYYTITQAYPDRDRLRSDISALVRKNACAASDAVDLISQGYAYRFIYNDVDGRFLVEVNISSCQ